MSQNDMNTDIYSKVKAFADELFDVSLIKTKIIFITITNIRLCS
jgi:hypothetical protein